MTTKAFLMSPTSVLFFLICPTFPAGVCPTVGVGGHITGGGYGNLFWAISGGGGASFGVISAYKISLVKVPDVVTVFRVVRTIEENAIDIVYRWQFIADKIDNNLFIRLTLKPVDEKQKGTKTITVTFVALYLGDSRELLSIMDRYFPQLGLHIKDCKEMSWIESELFWASFPNGTPPDALLNRKPGAKFLKRKSDYLRKPIPRDKLKSFTDTRAILYKVSEVKFIQQLDIQLLGS